jgi:hypothetical protein
MFYAETQYKYHSSFSTSLISTVANNMEANISFYALNIADARFMSVYFYAGGILHFLDSISIKQI